MERHIQTVMIALVTGAILFAGNYFFTRTEKDASEATSLQFISSQVVEVRGDIRALQATSINRVEFSSLETRVRTLEQAVTDLRARIQGRRE